MSQRLRDIGRNISSGSQKRSKAMAKKDRKRKGAVHKFFQPLRVYPQRHTTLKMATMWAVSLIMVRQIVKLEVYVPEVIFESVDSGKGGISSAGPDLTDAKPWADPLVRPPLPIVARKTMESVNQFAKMTF